MNYDAVINMYYLSNSFKALYSDADLSLAGYVKFVSLTNSWCGHRLREATVVETFSRS